MKIILADPIDRKAFEEIKKIAEVKDASKLPRLDLLKELQNYDVLVVRSKTQADAELLQSAPKLKAVIRAGAGLDNVDAGYCSKHSIKVLNTPEAPAISVAELAIALMLSLLRKIPQADSSVKEKKWLKSELSGKELFGKTLGIIGLGRIGQQVAIRAKAFGMKVLVYDAGKKAGQVKEFGEYVSLDDLLKNSDIISLHIPLTPETENSISEKEFQLMKNGSYLINTARGPIINEDALIKALESGKLAGAGLDVYWDETPFKSKIMQFRDKVVLTPHLGAQTAEAQARVGELLVEKIRQLSKEIK